MKKYDVTGMTCAACSARVEKAVCSVPGVESCAVNLLTNSVGVSGTAKPDAIIAAVEKAGYGARLSGEKKETKKDASRNAETSGLLFRLCSSLLVLLVLMYVSMGHNMLHFPLPAFFSGNPLAVGLLQMLLSSTVLLLNRHFFVNGTLGLIRRAPNMDTLVALGSGASFVYSVCLLFAMTRSENPHALLHGLYFESAAMIVVLITLGKMLEARAKGKTTSALEGLIKLTPKIALVLRDGQETEIPASEVRENDIFIVKSGAAIPADGLALEGHGTVDEAALTGESIPAEKEEGSTVHAGTVCLTGFIKCRATNVGEDTTLSRIIRMVTDASATKAPIAKAADRVSGIFVPVVLLIAILTAVLWLCLGQSVGFALTKAISVLVISCPCALGLATPVAIMVGSGLGAKNSILFKTAVALEMAGRIQTVALDKTGTITEGKPVVTDILPAEGITPEELLALAFSLEVKSEHPLAYAIVQRARLDSVPLTPTEDFSIQPGGGVSATVSGDDLYGGNLRFIREKVALSSDVERHAEALAEDGKTPLFFVKNQHFLGIIAVRDAIKPDSREAISALKKMGIHTVMLTGDNKKTAQAIGREVGVDEVLASVMPAEKEAKIRALASKGKTAMVGDGINDAPALTRADLGIAIGAGTDIAIDAADVVLTRSRLSDAVAAIRLGRGTLRNIHQNLFWAFIYNTLGIPMAAGAFLPLFGLELTPMFGAAAMSLSSVCVVSNALRLNFLQIHSGAKDKKIRRKEKKEMQKTIHIEGMMCPHCEGRVKKILESIDGVTSAECSHATGTAVLTLSDPVSDTVLRQAVENEGYTVTGI
ncbi:MAG: heavy metal translocating P-type ATPase [Ruminococcaceae bacterium]|nr:heavy metal translocating P-type ATPase [Oscillospiraceae bacterium]